MNERFNNFTSKAASLLGRSWAFVLACVAIVVWLITGPIAGFSDTWQLIINTSTTIITFLMVFIIQNTQNRDNAAINLKLDAILTGLKEIDEKKFVGIEALPDTKLEKKQKKVQAKDKRKG